MSIVTNGLINLESIVSKPTWKQILLDLIVSEDLDPWNVNIVAIADGFLKKVREMEKLDLMVPANIILASAILLRYKSSYLKLYEPAPELEMAVADEVFEPEQIPQLTITSRIPPKRQITLDELVVEMEKVIKYDGVDRKPKIRGGIDEIVNLQLSDSDIEKRMDFVYNRIKNNLDAEGWVTFSKILDGKEASDVIYFLLSVLHLTQREVLDIRQDEWFGEIFIRLRDKNNQFVDEKIEIIKEEN